MSGWDDIVAGALLGTERRPPAPPGGSAGPAADAVLAALPWADAPEAALLGAAGVLATARRAGRRVPRVEEPPAPAPPETLPLCTPRALELLRACLGVPQSDLVALWLDRAAAARVRVPPQRIPMLLDRATGQRALRPALRTAGGTRLTWLAAQEPRWAWAAAGAASVLSQPGSAGGAPAPVEAPAYEPSFPTQPGFAGGASTPDGAAAIEPGAPTEPGLAGGASTPGDASPPHEPGFARDASMSGGASPSPDPTEAALASWSTATTDERAATLTTLRQGEHPERGRALVESSWAEDPPEERVRWARALADGLSDADEPFLEAALDDRRKPVRDEAAELLERLPGSRRALRMAARLATLLGGDGRLRRHVTVALPEAPDAAGVRDGLAAKGRGGVRGENLTRIVRGAPLTSWAKLTGHGPDALLAQLAGENVGTVASALTAAAAAQRSANWALALVERIPPPLLAEDPAARALLALLPTAERNAVGAALLKATEPRAGLALAADVLPGPWDAALSARAVDAAAQAAAASWWNDQGLLAALSVRLDPSVRRRIERHRDALPHPQALVTLLGLLDLRAAIEQALPPAPESP